MAICPKTEREKLSSDLTKGDEHFKQTAVLTEAENQIQGKLKMNDFPTLQAVGQSGERALIKPSPLGRPMYGIYYLS